MDRLVSPLPRVTAPAFVAGIKRRGATSPGHRHPDNNHFCAVCRFPYYVGGVPFIPDRSPDALGVGLGRPSLCRYFVHRKHYSSDHSTVPDHPPIIPDDVGGAAKGSRMAQVNDAKRRVIEEIARARSELSGVTSAVKEQLNFPRRFTVVWRKYSWTWMGLAALAGWILSRLPSRKKKVYIQAGKRVRRGKGFVDTVVGQLWSLSWSVTKPALTAYLTRKMSQKP
jgi:hypothetical protein